MGLHFSVDRMLHMVLDKDASDLHLVSGDPPRCRQYGHLQQIDSDRMDAKDLQDALFGIMGVATRETFEQRDGCDFAYALQDTARFRVNVFRHLGGIGAVFRAIPSQAMTIEELSLPSVVRTLCNESQGMILVTGKTGSGKSTTLAAMIDHINDQRKGHIITIEDPIEFVHSRKQCLMSQREIGVHTPSFSSALHSALREDPDVILVGELRDLETMGIAVTAAETGILVMGTLHTNGAAPTVDRIVNSFPAEKQGQIRTMLSTSLRGVISQQLCRRDGREGRAAALEILVNTPAVANLIRQGKLDQLENIMQGGSQLGMQSMDSALKDLLAKKTISGQEAYRKAFNKEQFAQFAN